MENPDRPRKRKYARIERERRFLLEGLPEAVDPEAYERLRDRYIEGTALRLRRVEKPEGSHIITKLGQKIPNPDAPANPRHRQMTTLYLEESEGRLFEVLPARVSVKRRYKLAEQGWTFVLDAYELPPSRRGLWIAEVECPDDEALEQIVCPDWALREITEEPQWSGAKLAEPE